MAVVPPPPSFLLQGSIYLTCYISLKTLQGQRRKSVKSQTVENTPKSSRRKSVKSKQKKIRQSQTVENSSKPMGKIHQSKRRKYVKDKNMESCQCQRIKSVKAKKGKPSKTWKIVLKSVIYICYASLSSGSSTHTLSLLENVLWFVCQQRKKHTENTYGTEFIY